MDTDYIIFGMKKETYEVEQLLGDNGEAYLNAENAAALAKSKKQDYEEIKWFGVDQFSDDSQEEIRAKIEFHMQPLDVSRPYVIVSRCKRVWSYFSDREAAEQELTALNTSEADHRIKDQPFIITDWPTVRMHERAINVTQAQEVTKERYWEMLEVLPPMNWGTRNGIESFFMSEFNTGTYTDQYAQYHDKYYTKGVDYCDSSTWISLDDIRNCAPMVVH
jgi:hypothetical protein